MNFGITETRKGHVCCVLQEDGMPLMKATKPLDYFGAWLLTQMANASNVSPLTSAVVDSLRRAEIFEPMAVQVW